MTEIVNKNIEDYILNHMKPESALFKELRDETYARMARPQMLSGPVVGNLLKLLVNLCNAKLVLELGMFTGYSALYMAEGLPSEGRIITCEIDPIALELAQKYFKRSNFGSKIEVRMGPGLETLKIIAAQDEPIDFVFIDADKANYGNYYREVLPLVRSGGLIVFDNALRQSRVLDPKENDSKAIDDVNKLIAADQKVENILLSIRDGVNVVRKK